MIDRRSLILGTGAAAGAVAFGTRARAQAKVAAPNLIKSGSLVMSINPTLPPLQFVNDKGELEGMRVELGNALAKQLGLTAEYVRIEFSAMVPGLAAKRWDMINTGIFWTEERSKLMYMIPYEQAAVSFLAARGNPLNISKWEDLAGRVVGVELGGIEERRTREVDEMLKKAGLKGIDIRTFNNFAEAFQALRARQVDAATSIDATAMYWQGRGDFSRAIAGLFPQTACFAFANKTLADAAVVGLNELRKSGYYDGLFDKYGVLKVEEKSSRSKALAPARLISYRVVLYMARRRSSRHFLVHDCGGRTCRFGTGQDFGDISSIPTCSAARASRSGSQRQHSYSGSHSRSCWCSPSFEEPDLTGYARFMSGYSGHTASGAAHHHLYRPTAARPHPSGRYPIGPPGPCPQ
jgi:polar amino acid transport system substrate-binding protein